MPIDITFICHIVCHMVAILECHKDDGRSEKKLNEDEFIADTVDNPKEGIEQRRKQECLFCNKQKQIAFTRWQKTIGT